MSLLDWSGKTAVILASGPSLKGCKAPRGLLSGVSGVIRLGVNATAITHDVDMAYAGDFMFVKKYCTKIPALHPRWTCDRSAAERYGWNHIKGVNRPGLGRNVIHMNGNSGAQAINLAYLFGARRILLLGFDMKLGPNGEKHHHPDHPAPCVQAQTFAQWIHAFDALARDLVAEGVQVLNCTPGSALECFPKSTIETELCL